MVQAVVLAALLAAPPGLAVQAAAAPPPAGGAASPTRGRGGHPASGPGDQVSPLDVRTFTLPNGLTVILHPDHRLPQVVVNTWVQVGSKDESPGRTGFAHLFEHLMFMGTQRVPGNRFDVLMETSGGANNASTSEDRTNYYSWGPSSALPLLLWLDADRLQALADAMTREKLDTQRDVVRNERRQSFENRPYGRAELVIPEEMYPDAHPYHHPVIGSHADLEAASLDDVKGFFRTHYVPANATLVVAGDFDPAQVAPLVTSLFGALAPAPVAARRRPPPARLEGEVRRVLVDEVELPRLYLVWHAPPAYAPGSAELELLAGVLGEGPSSRLEHRLVQDLRLAESVEVELYPQVLGSLFLVQVTGVPGADLERVKREALAVLGRVAAAGPTAAELARVKAQRETRFRVEREELRARADKLNEYRFFFGEADGFARDLARFTGASAAGLRDAARTLGEGRLDLRVTPARPGARAELPAKPPPAFPAGAFAAPAPETFRLSSGVEVRVVRRPGSGLFAGHLVTAGGERLVPAEKAGLAPILARLLVSGARGKSASGYADAVRTLGAQVEASATRTALDVSVVGLTSRLEPTLELFADAFLRPNLAPADFEREAALARARVGARADDPRHVARVASAAALYGLDDFRGRPVDGYVRTVERIRLEDVRRSYAFSGMTVVLVGDRDQILPQLKRAGFPAPALADVEGRAVMQPAAR